MTTNSFISDELRETTLQYLIDYGNRFDLCNKLVTDYNEATDINNIGTKLIINYSSIFDTLKTNGITVENISNGMIMNTGNAAFWAISNANTETLLISGKLKSFRNVTSGNKFNVNSFKILIGK